MMNFKGSQFEREIILWAVRWYVAYPISYRQLEEMMGERGVAVDHSTLNRWVIKYAPEFAKAFRRRQRSSLACPQYHHLHRDQTHSRLTSAITAPQTPRWRPPAPGDYASQPLTGTRRAALLGRSLKKLAKGERLR